jgi:hypothetical protein
VSLREFDYTAEPSRRSFLGLPDFRDRLPCRLSSSPLIAKINSGKLAVSVCI